MKIFYIHFQSIKKFLEKNYKKYLLIQKSFVLLYCQTTKTKTNKNNTDMKATTKNILDKAAEVAIYGIGGATLLLILFTTICAVVRAANETSMCIFGCIQ